MRNVFLLAGLFAASCSAQDTITLSGDYGYERYRISEPEADLIDASDASWIVSSYVDVTREVTP